MGWNLPPGCTDRDIDEASPGYWDEPDTDCWHEDYDADILTGRATCNMCGHSWWQTSEEIEREQRHQIEYAKLCEAWNAEPEPNETAAAELNDDDLPF